MTEIVQTPRTETAPGLIITALFLGAIVLGSVLGLLDPSIGTTVSQGVDFTLLVMLGLLFFEARLRAVAAGLANMRFIGMAWGVNFLLVPLIGYAIASLFLSGHPLLFAGLLIYFLAPCTDWFLSFTRMARGDTALGTALMPINMLTQLLLFPVWIWVAAKQTGMVDFAAIPDVMVVWFLVPFVTAQVARWLLERLLPQNLFNKICVGVGYLIPVVTALLIFQIFAANVTTIAAHLETFGLTLMAIFAFFIVMFFAADRLSRLFGLRYEERALLSMTTAARNAPLMLAMTAIALPEQPLIYAALVIGMLVEFPHLTALKQVLLTQAAREGAAASARSWQAGSQVRCAVALGQGSSNT